MLSKDDVKMCRIVCSSYSHVSSSHSPRLKIGNEGGTALFQIPSRRWSEVGCGDSAREGALSGLCVQVIQVIQVIHVIFTFRLEALFHCKRRSVGIQRLSSLHSSVCSSILLRLGCVRRHGHTRQCIPGRLLRLCLRVVVLLHCSLVQVFVEGTACVFSRRHSSTRHGTTYALRQERREWKSIENGALGSGTAEAAAAAR
mmetsp:Transcript_97248/g.142333  ORF Transcript_97248/g.142333 Transcript_97248/m.142333 type:complete len:200 (-) Transcript_97248:2590-3189(-)